MTLDQAYRIIEAFGVKTQKYPLCLQDIVNGGHYSPTEHLIYINPIFDGNPELPGILFHELTHFAGDVLGLVVHGPVGLTENYRFHEELIARRTEHILVNLYNGKANDIHHIRKEILDRIEILMPILDKMLFFGKVEAFLRTQKGGDNHDVPRTIG